MEHLGEAIRIARKEGALFVENSPKWKGNEIWQLHMEDPRKEQTMSSLPTFLMFGKNGPRFLSDSEVMDYMRYLGNEIGYEDDERTLKGFESTLVPVK